MKPGCFLCLLLLVCWTPRVAGQHYLAIKEGEKMTVVVAARGVLPLVLHDGKLESVHTSRLALGEGGEYLPMFVAVRNIQVNTYSEMVVGSMAGGEINREFHLRCELETAYLLDHVFAVIVVHNRGGESGLFLFEVSRLEPRVPTPLHVLVPMNMGNEGGHYDFYLFSGGRELFQSQMPSGLMDTALDRMVQDRIKDVKDSPVKPFVGPTPEYPKALYRKGIDGRAVISFVIDARGAIGDPAVVSTSQPEFGQAALVAIRQWRFLPRVKDGRPVESRARMPFEFTAPKEK
jgi:TonB family protein